MKREWKIFVAREYVDLTTVSGVDYVLFREPEKFYKTKKEWFFTYCFDNNFTHYTIADFYKIGRKLYLRKFGSIKKNKEFYKDGLEWIKKDKSLQIKWKKVLQSKNGFDLLDEAFSDFKKMFGECNDIFSIIPYIAIESFQSDLNNTIDFLVKKNKLEDQREQINNSIYKPWKKTAILKIIDDYHKGITIKKLVEKYQFLRSWSVIWYRPINSKWVENICKKQKIKYKENPISIDKAIALLKPNKEQKRIIELAPYLIYIKDWRDDVRRSQAYGWHFLFESIAHNFQIAVDDLGYLTLDEIQDVLKNKKLNRKLIERRKINPCVVTRNSSSITPIVIEGSRRLKKYELSRSFKSTINNTNSFTGLIAQTGKEKGRVSIINTYHDIKKVKRGDILVANTTHPNYIPAMKKASAIVTNEGGIISHAAIVARELKKPCIVGTKIATKVLKDGDIVEVDADKGIVKIIK
ncbi:MAG: PEP-utilizing enzyme [Patescibacteria group bacterium]|jgi:phosphohistidine swiveling domain-containing protein